VLYGILEFGWTSSQVLDMPQGARKGARLAAVDYQPQDETGSDQTDEIIAVICSRIDDPEETRVRLEFDTSGGTGAGDSATIEVERDLEQLSGFFAPILNGVTPGSEVTFRLEQPADWSATSGFQDCP